MTNLFSKRILFLFCLLQCALIVNAREYPLSFTSTCIECKQVTQFTDKFPFCTPLQAAFSFVQFYEGLTGDDFCKGLKKIIKESGTAYKDVRFNKKDDEDMEGSFNYETRLPKLGFENIRIFEEEAMQNVKGIKTIYSCMLSSDINNRTAAETKYKETIAAVTGCVSKTGEAKKSDDTLQWYTVEMEENGQLKEIKIKLTHYSSASSLTLEIFYFSKD